MKKIFLAIAVLASMQVASAGVKPVAVAKKLAEKAEVAASDQKKAAKTATWINLGKAMVDAYVSPMGDAWVGASKQDLQLIMPDVKPIDGEGAYTEVVVGGTPMLLEKYENCNYYYSYNWVIQMITVTKPIFPNALEMALDAYQHAAALDVQNKKFKDISAGIRKVSGYFRDEAYNAYSFENLEDAHYYFLKTVEATDMPGYIDLDTNSVYNAALTGWMLGRTDVAKEYFERSLELGYYGEDGDTYAKLADIADKAGDKALCKEYLEAAFQKFPQSQSVLVGLINYYITSGEDTNRLFDLIATAKANEPNNASLYYVEGNIHLQLGQVDDAIAAYLKCSEINPEYEYGFIGIGQYWYNRAVELSEKASDPKISYKEYDALVEEMNVALKNCIEPFENAFKISKDASIKKAIAEYLKNTYFRFREESADYMAAYEKYNEISANGI